jgi:hypothetical protein
VLRATAGCAAALAMLFATCAQALIFFGTGDVNFNTTAPTGTYADSGWQWIGALGGIAGVPIGPRHFLAAQHIGGSVGQQFTFNGAAYTTVAAFDDPASDLRIWQIDGTFPAQSWAPLYRVSGEVGSTAVAYGRGSTRGSPVTTTRSNGWMWAAGDGRLRWGTNTVYSIQTVGGGAGFAALYMRFDQGGGTNEVQAAGGDSSGPVFINDGSGYKLAGVTYAVDCCFNTTNSGDGFQAAIFDVRGLYFGNASSGWTKYSGPTDCKTGDTCLLNPLPAGFYSTRVSARLSWIDSILSRQPQAITFPAIGDRSVNQSPFTPSVSDSSGLPVTLSVVSGPATVSGTSITLTGLGTVTLQASQTGDATFLPATPVQQTFNVTAATTNVPTLPLFGLAVLALGLIALHTMYVAA